MSLALQPMLNFIGHGALLPSSSVTKELAKLLCSNILTGLICESGVFLIADVDSKELNKVSEPAHFKSLCLANIVAISGNN